MAVLYRGRWRLSVSGHPYSAFLFRTPTVIAGVSQNFENREALCWPVLPVFPLGLPDTLKRCVDAFSLGDRAAQFSTIKEAACNTKQFHSLWLPYLTRIRDSSTMPPLFQYKNLFDFESGFMS